MSPQAKSQKKLSLSALAEKHVRSLEIGKAAYREADQAMDELAERAEVGQAIRVGSTQYVLVDQFADRNRVASGLSVRRYKLEEQKARDVTKKL